MLLLMNIALTAMLLLTAWKCWQFIRDVPCMPLAKTVAVVGVAAGTFGTIAAWTTL